MFISSDKIQEALKEFTEIATKYKKTPLKHELLVRILTLMSDGHTEENFLINEKANSKLNKHLQAALNMIKKVHGAGDVPVRLVFCFVLRFCYVYLKSTYRIHHMG